MPNETNNLPDINPDIPNNEAVSKEIPLPEEAVPAACEPDCESAPETAVPELSAYEEESGSDEDDDFAEDEIIDEDEFIEEDEPIDEDEFIEEDEPIDDDEFIDVEAIPLDKLAEMCVSGEITDGKTIAAVLKAKYIFDKRK